MLNHHSVEKTIVGKHLSQKVGGISRSPQTPLCFWHEEGDTEAKTFYRKAVSRGHAQRGMWGWGAIGCPGKTARFSLRSLQVYLTLWDPTECSPPVLCPWDFPGTNTGGGCHSLLQGIFPTQGSNLGLLHCSRFFTTESAGKPGVARGLSHHRRLRAPERNWGTKAAGCPAQEAKSPRSGVGRTPRDLREPHRLQFCFLCVHMTHALPRSPERILFLKDTGSGGALPLTLESRLPLWALPAPSWSRLPADSGASYLPQTTGGGWAAQGSPRTAMPFPLFPTPGAFHVPAWEVQANSFCVYKSP